MAKVAKGIFRGVSILVATIILVVLLLYGGIYVALLTPAGQNRVRTEGEKFLSEYLHTQVTIGDVSISPFDQVVLYNVTIPDQQGDSLIAIDRLAAGISLRDLIMKKKMVFTHGDINGLHGRITRPDKNSPTNLQFIIDAFKPKDDKPPKPFDVQVQTVVIRNSDITYDVLDQAHRPAGRLDPNHLAVRDLNADIALPRLKNNDFEIHVKRLAFAERNGLEVKQLCTNVCITDTTLQVSDIDLKLPNSNLKVGEMALSFSSLKNLGEEIKTMPLDVTLAANPVTPSDFKSLVPELAAWNEPVRLNTHVLGDRNDIHVPQLQLNMGEHLALDFNGSVHNLSDKNNLTVHAPHIKLNASANDIARITSHLPAMSAQARDIVSRCGSVRVDGNADYAPGNVKFTGNIGTGLGDVDIDGVFAQKTGSDIKLFNGHVKTPRLMIGKLLNKTDVLGEVGMNANVDLALQGKQLSGTLDGHIDFIDLKQHRLHDITANVNAKDNTYDGRLTINDALGRLALEGTARIDGSNTEVHTNLTANNFDFAKLGVLKNYSGHRLSFDAQANVTGNSTSNINGIVNLYNISFADQDNKGLHIDNLTISADNQSSPKHININSDYINGSIEGNYNLNTLVPTIKSMLSAAFPKYFASSVISASHEPTNVKFDFTLDPDEELESFFKLPIKVVHNSTLKGFIDESAGSMEAILDAPYLLQGNKIIEGSSIVARLDSATHNATLHVNTLIPNKKGKIAVTLDANGVNNRLDANLGWRVMREHDFHGDLNLSALIDRHPDRGLDVNIDINPTQLVFNDTAWQVDPGHITIDHGTIIVDNLVGHCDKQHVQINGKVSKNPDDELHLDLNDVSLDYVFETLNINNVDFGGRATGHFYASDLLSGAPRLATPGLHVDGLRYNKALMGDADIKSHWMNEEKAVSLTADVAQENGEHTTIDGAIFVADDSLYLEFDANRVNIAFMKPFMQAFTSDVQGEASGKATLFGNFHTINLKGDIIADSLRFKLDYTNVVYTCSNSSVHIVPNLITFDNVHFHDRDGHEAIMDGWLKHDAFHDPVFNFGITKARDLLCYDTDANINPDWYGTIYGNGSAFVTGEPGIVDIKVNMESAPRSTFTFVLSDAKNASDYTFITFRDRDKKDLPPEPVVQDTLPEIVRRLTAQVKQEEVSQPTHYNIDLQGDITPDAQLILVMDPVGGDRIKARGRGNMRMTYNDADEMTIYGKYTLERGDYNFTLQDIIIKDFTIRDGSSISFQGDPYDATLDIEAVYSLNANLRDLDDGFAQDKEINRTTVPVHALLKAKGAISQPEIAFDLEFPTLTSDSYRKVKSIINTDEMMNRQIIYLLALNRFYTPDYMNTTTRGNELTSVASSTISSQLSNILGKMSDKWSISPNFRSDKGDFSDMEVDLALSSQLLNNRLLLNGNFGYRDNTYNTRNTNFIGDFDIEYLLTPKGTLRLKAYNHFNDQNYYVRNALTTQGVGLVWKHDFDKPLDFLKPKLKATTASTDTVPQDSQNKKQ